MEDPLAKIRYFMRDIGDVNAFLIIFIPLAIFFFFLLTKPYATYFNEELYPAFENHHVTSRLNITPNLWMNGDGELLARVFENLLTNAIRYGKDGQFVDINCELNEEQVIVQVINYGGFIAPEELPHIFDMYEQVLAYSLPKNIVEQHNGTITAESNVVRTQFEVKLPAT